MSAWLEICNLEDLVEDAGICALVAGQQVALFYFSQGQQVFAVGNFDPIGQANVLSRGMIGDVKGEPMVASPLYKQHFSLVTGRCLEQPEQSVPVYPLRIEGRKVLVANAPLPLSSVSSAVN